jgi:hypothetical protein
MVSSQPRDFYVWSTLSQETFTYGQLSAKRLLSMVNSQPRDFYVWSALSQKTLTYGQLLAKRLFTYGQLLAKRLFMYGQLSAKRLSRMVNSQPRDFHVWSTLIQETFMYGQLSSKPAQREKSLPHSLNAHLNPFQIAGDPLSNRLVLFFLVCPI